MSCCLPLTYAATRADLPGPSRRIIVEPIEQPVEEPRVLPEPEQVPARREPVLP